MGTDDAELEREPAVDVDGAWTQVQRRAARARRGRLIVVSAASVVLLVGGAALVRSVTDNDPSRVESTDPAADVTVPATPEPGDAAFWTTDPGAPPSTTASTFTALVTRLGCSGGVTGEVLRPGVVVDGSEVVVTFTVATIGDGDHTCPGNDAVPYEVDLGEALGDRTLVDGGCVPQRAGGTSSCEGGGVRWPLEHEGA